MLARGYNELNTLYTSSIVTIGIKLVNCYGGSAGCLKVCACMLPGELLCIHNDFVKTKCFHYYCVNDCSENLWNVLFLVMSAAFNLIQYCVFSAHAVNHSLEVLLDCKQGSFKSVTETITIITALKTLTGWINVKSDGANRRVLYMFILHICKWMKKLCIPTTL